MSLDNEESAVLRCRGLRKVYGSKVAVEALKGIDLSISHGDFLAITGPSGSGKSTLMHLMGCLLRPTEGEIWVEGIAISKLSESQLADVRGRKVGFVFQQFNLLSRMSALKNVSLPLTFQGVSRKKRELRARQLLEDLGLGHRTDHLPTELSGGQRQRVAIARALVADPAIILADEPTGNLDTKTGSETMDILDELSERGRTIVVVTHENHIAARTKRRINLVDGRIVSGGIEEEVGK